jgi:hypothetical protein
MTDPRNTASNRRGRAWLALALLPLLSGCLGAVALPLLAGGGLMARQHHRVRAATQVPAPAVDAAAAQQVNRPALAPPIDGSVAVLTSLKELPPPSGAAPAVAADDTGQPLIAYTLEQSRASGGESARPASALLKQPPTIEAPIRRDCKAPVPAVIIDLDDGANPFVPERLSPAPAAVADGLARLRQASVVVLWISRLPATRAAEIGQALRASGLDPQGQDQLLLLRNGDDRKQALREDASKDVCVVAIAGAERGDFDELFDYLRNPGSAVGLYPMMGEGWFLVPSLDTAATVAHP